MPSDYLFTANARVNKDKLVVITRYYMEDGIHDIKIENITGSLQSVYLNYSFPRAAFGQSSEPDQIIVVTDTLLGTLIAAKCLKYTGMTYDEAMLYLESRGTDDTLGPILNYWKSQIELLYTGVSEDLCMERIKLLNTYIGYIVPSNGDRLWSLYETIKKFETWSIPEVETLKQETLDRIEGYLAI